MEGYVEVGYWSGVHGGVCGGGVLEWGTERGMWRWGTGVGCVYPYCGIFPSYPSPFPKCEGAGL